MTDSNYEVNLNNTLRYLIALCKKRYPNPVFYKIDDRVIISIELYEKLMIKVCRIELNTSLKSESYDGQIVPKKFFERAFFFENGDAINSVITIISYIMQIQHISDIDAITTFDQFLMDNLDVSS